MIRIVTDSNAQLPAELARRLGIEIVPLTVVVDGAPRPEVELDADLFFATLSRHPRPEVSTAAPSPGDFARVYEQMGRGDEVVSVHIGSEMSATVQAARLAAESAPCPVTVVDTHAASFIVGCAAWEAADAAADGRSAAEVAEVARRVAADAKSVFIVGAVDLARAGGRFGEALAGAEAGRPADPVPVLVLEGGHMEAIGQASRAEEAVEAMAERILAAGPGLRVGVTVADPASEPLWKGLEQALDGRPEIDELLRYRAGPSVAVHTGPGTAGAVYYRRPVS
jgi:DegV family protein with EDD domain